MAIDAVGAAGALTGIITGLIAGITTSITTRIITAVTTGGDDRKRARRHAIKSMDRDTL